MDLCIRYGWTNRNPPQSESRRALMPQSRHANNAKPKQIPYLYRLRHRRVLWLVQLVFPTIPYTIFIKHIYRYKNKTIRSPGVVVLLCGLNCNTNLHKLHRTFCIWHSTVSIRISHKWFVVPFTRGFSPFHHYRLASGTVKAKSYLTGSIPVHTSTDPMQKSGKPDWLTYRHQLVKIKNS